MKKYLTFMSKQPLPIVLSLLLLCFTPKDSLGQSFLETNPEFYHQGNGHFHISLEGGYDSDGIRSNLFRSFLKGGLLEQELREASSPDISEINRLALSYSSDISFSFPAPKILKNDSLSLILNVRQEQNLTVKYDHTFYTLLFQGNGSFNGELAKFEDINFENWLTRSVGIGVHNRKNGNQIRINFHQGVSRQKFSFANGETQTLENGQLLTGNVTGNLFSNQFNENDSTNTFGSGLGLDGMIRIMNSSKSGQLLFNFRNLGFMKWPKGTQEIDLINKYTFEGVDLSDIFSPDFNSIEIGDINSYLEIEKTEAKNIELLPIHLRLDYWKTLNNKITFNLGVTSKLIYNWRPEIVASIFSPLKPNWHIGGGIKYGGFGKPNLNLSSFVLIKNNWYANVNISYLSGWVSKTGYGSHLRLGLARVLNFNKKVS